VYKSNKYLRGTLSIRIAQFSIAKGNLKVYLCSVFFFEIYLYAQLKLVVGPATDEPTITCV
jgi:hypothetical protein